MSSTETQPTLAMPVGLPASGVDAATFFATLSGLIEADVTAEYLIDVWTDPSHDYSGVYPMVKGFVWYVPAGSAGLDGATAVSTPTIYCRTWLDEYLSLRSASGGAGAVIPAIIEYSNLDETEVQTEITTLISTDARYAELTADQKIALAADFVAGSARMLIDAGTRIGAGQVDSTHSSGYRKAAIRLLDTDGAALSPSFYFSLWDAIGGTWVDDHPLIPLVQGPVAPAIVPVDGHLRVKINGTGLTAATVVTIGGQAATYGWATADGTALYVTVPEAAAGAKDLVVGATTYAGALAYTEDVVATAGAALESWAVAVEELIDRANDLSAAGTLDDEAKYGLRYVLEQAGLTASSVIDTRRTASGAAAEDPAVAELFASRLDALRSLEDAATAAIG